MDLDGSSGDAPGGWSLDDIKRYLTLQRYLPKNGGLFGSGWARFMADQESATPRRSSAPFVPNPPTAGFRAVPSSPAIFGGQVAGPLPTTSMAGAAMPASRSATYLTQAAPQFGNGPTPLQTDYSNAVWSGGSGPDGSVFLDRGLAGPADGAQLFDVGWKTQQHRRGWEKREGRDWPTTATGQNYHVSHKIAKADGGPDTLDNVEPEHPAEHIARHKANGDFARWGARGGRPQPQVPEEGLKIRGLGLLGFLPDITGILSGRIRTDTFQHFISDMGGPPSPDDIERENEARCRSLGFPYRRGDICT
jgi:hypothetical protein